MERDNAPNLTAHRAAASVWERRGWQGRTIEERVGPWLVSLAGAGLLAYGAGATRRSWRGVWWMVSGAGLIGCAAAGLANPREVKARWDRSVRQPPADPVTRESMDSFPASDAPSSNATTASPSHLHPREG
jgi:hypothetical protein